MKKRVVMVLCAVLLLCSCKSGNKGDITVYPQDLLPSEIVEAYTGYKPNVTQEFSRRVSKAKYLPEQLGKNDPVILEFYQANQLMSKEKIESIFDENKSMRSDSFDVGNLGAKAYIAYPSIHYYINGYYVKITAGSKSDDMQKSLLENLASESYEKLKEITGVKYEEPDDSESVAE